MTVEGNPVGGLTDHRYVNQPQPVTGQSPTPSQPYNPVGGNGLPYLYNPSRQYQARMSPAMYQQYLGYEQMRTGATPQDIDWRLASMAPSTARYGLSYRR